MALDEVLPNVNCTDMENFYQIAKMHIRIENFQDVVNKSNDDESNSLNRNKKKREGDNKQAISFSKKD
ncbi:hypothetical protein PanWU01x14_365980 [Parasponia andersonii]|uniref:Uncharacterized protein n=1 Tax=Parasponia andersonii TaxID=3476 RepID=A0A2P5A5T3_PARAD|nr:hypothetical protein PanWU01x14_365980 [Parasponia andersonii]